MANNNLNSFSTETLQTLSLTYFTTVAFRTVLFERTTLLNAFANIQVLCRRQHLKVKVKLASNSEYVLF